MGVMFFFESRERSLALTSHSNVNEVKAYRATTRQGCGHDTELSPSNVMEHKEMLTWHKQT